MDEQAKRKAIHEFFVAPIPNLSIKSIFVGSLIAIIGIFLTAQVHSWFLALFVIGVLWAILKPLTPEAKPGINQEVSPSKIFNVLAYSKAKSRFEARPTVDEMRKWLFEDLENLKNYAFRQLNLDEDDITREPVIVVGPVYWSDVQGISDDLVLCRFIGNNQYFYSTYNFTIFHFTQNFLGAFTANYNMIKNYVSTEATDEYFYKDVVSVSTKTESSNYTLKTGERLEQSKTFALTASSGHSISVILDDPVIKSGINLEDYSQDAVNNIRTMLREKKTDNSN